MRRKIEITFVLTLFFSVLSFPAFSGHTPVHSTTDLIAKLQQGGYILYVRHAKTDHSQNDNHSGDLSNCNTQRNLSAEGVKQSQFIANKLKEFAISVKTAWSSPYCRCIDTAKALFPNYKVKQSLQFSISKNEAESKRLAQMLKQMMLAVDDKHNYAFVGHTANLKDALDVWPKPEGVIVVFKNNNGVIEYQGQITPEDWQKVNN